jgi:hypothetical protein
MRHNGYPAILVRLPEVTARELDAAVSTIFVEIPSHTHRLRAPS